MNSGHTRVFQYDKELVEDSKYLYLDSSSDPVVEYLSSNVNFFSLPASSPRIVQFYSANSRCVEQNVVRVDSHVQKGLQRFQGELCGDGERHSR